MVTPLRKEHPEFDDEQEITSADLAQGKAPASETRRPQMVTGKPQEEWALSKDSSAAMA